MSPRPHVLALLYVAAITTTSACLAPEAADDEPTGEVTASLSTVPVDVRCIELTAVSADGAVTRSFAVTPGAAAVMLNLATLPRAQLHLTGEAYAAACQTADLAGEPGLATWELEPLDVELIAGRGEHLTLVFHRRANTSGTVDFAPTVVEVAVGGNTSYAVLDDGSVLSWGWNGALGVMQWPPAPRAGLSDVVSISAELENACALIGDGTVQCWGSNASGQLGDGTTTTRQTPVEVAGLTEAVAVDVGRRHACAVRRDGVTWCWGENGEGQLGDGTTIDRTTPVRFGGPFDRVTSVTAGQSHTCGVRLSYGDTVCGGLNVSGQLGDGTTTTGGRPRYVVWGEAGGPAGSLSAGSSHTCQVRHDGLASCWGRNDFGQVGDLTTTDRNRPTMVAGLPDAIAIAAGSLHTCAILADGTVRCWGRGYHGVLGDGSGQDRATPVEVHGLADVVQVSAGEYHTCAVTTTSGVWCWGYGGGIAGELETFHWVPIRVL